MSSRDGLVEHVAQALADDRDGPDLLACDDRHDAEVVVAAMFDYWARNPLVVVEVLQSAGARPANHHTVVALLAALRGEQP